MHRIAKFLRHNWTDRLLLIEALVWLAWAKTIVHLVPFRWIAPHLGQRQTESPKEIDISTQQAALSIKWAIEAVIRHAPVEFVCLPQGLAAKWMLRRRQLPSTLYLGLRRPQDADLQAHAWLRVGEQVLTGRVASTSHQMIAAFGEHRLSH